MLKSQSIVERLVTFAADARKRQNMKLRRDDNPSGDALYLGTPFVVVAVAVAVVVVVVVVAVVVVIEML